MSNRFSLGRASTNALIYIVLVVVLPLATLSIVGLVFLWQKNLLLLITALWLLAACLAYAVLIYWPKIKSTRLNANTDSEHDNNNSEPFQTDNVDNLPRQLSARSNWTEKDQQIWERCCVSIDTQLQTQPDWQMLPELALHQLALISQHYHGSGKKAQFQFTVPELLLVVSITSSRYRQLVIEHVPFIDKFTIATGSTLFDQKENISTGYKWFSRLRRTARLLNPASAVVGELRDLISNKIFSQASEAVQNDLKRLLLQEATQVGIDLYSGKLAVSEQELNTYRSQAAQADEQRLVEPAEPIRIVLIGQTSSGKSSLVNALTDALQAEVDVLPATDRLGVHQLHIEGEPVAHLIDTPGIDGSSVNAKQLLESVMEADLIIWLAKATQPARAPDQELFAAIQNYFTTENKKLQPPVIMVLTYIDQLSPKSQWNPPYDLQSDEPKARSITAALNSARSSIGFSDDTLAVPVYIGDAYAKYNIDALASQVMLLNDSSINVQLNRRRIELGSNRYDWQTRWTQTKNLGRVLGQTIIKRVKD